MNYNELKPVIKEAWTSFFSTLDATGVVDIDKLENNLNMKDIYYPVMCAVVEASSLEVDDDL